MLASMKHTLERQEPLNRYLPLGYTSNHHSPECLAGSRLFKTAQNFISNGPEAAQQGDVIAYFEGGSNLYILRPQHSSSQFIGTAFLSGVTNGEVLPTAGSSECSEFVLQ
jgi:hypothetical protein